MKVIKRDGRVQELEVEKIRLSILNASIDGKNIVNEADLKILSSEVMKKLKDLRGIDGDTSSYEITDVILSVLIQEGFSDIAKQYIKFDR